MERAPATTCLPSIAIVANLRRRTSTGRAVRRLLMSGGTISAAMSPIGTSRHFAASQQLGRLRSEADILVIVEYAHLCSSNEAVALPCNTTATRRQMSSFACMRLSRCRFTAALGGDEYHNMSPRLPGKRCLWQFVATALCDSVRDTTHEASVLCHCHRRDVTDSAKDVRSRLRAIRRESAVWRSS